MYDVPPQVLLSSLPQIGWIRCSPVPLPPYLCFGCSEPTRGTTDDGDENDTSLKCWLASVVVVGSILDGYGNSGTAPVPVGSHLLALLDVDGPGLFVLDCDGFDR